MKVIRLLDLCLMAISLTLFGAVTAVAQSEYILPTGQPIRPPYRAIMDTEYPAQDWGHVLAYNAQMWTNSRFRGNGQEWLQHHFACQTGDTIISPGLLLEPGEYTLTIKADLMRSIRNIMGQDNTIHRLEGDPLKAIVRWGEDITSLSATNKLGEISIPSAYQDIYEESDPLNKSARSLDRYRHIRRTQEFTISVPKAGTYYVSMEILEGYDNQKDSLYTSLPFVSISRTSHHTLKYVYIGRRKYAREDCTKDSIPWRGFDDMIGDKPYFGETDEGSSEALDSYSRIRYSQIPRGLLSGLHKGDTICSAAFFFRYTIGFPKSKKQYKDLDFHFYNLNEVGDEEDPTDWMRNSTDSLSIIKYYGGNQWKIWNKKITPAGFVHNTFAMSAYTDESEPPSEGTWYAFRYEMPLDVPFVFQGPTLGLVTKRYQNDLVTDQFYKKGWKYTLKYFNMINDDMFKPTTIHMDEYEMWLHQPTSLPFIPTVVPAITYPSSGMQELPIIVLGVKPCPTERFKVTGTLISKSTGKRMRNTHIMVEYSPDDIFYGTTDDFGYFQIDVDGVRDHYYLSFVIPNAKAMLYDKDAPDGKRPNLSARITSFDYEGYDINLGPLYLDYVPDIPASISHGVKPDTSDNVIYDLQGRKYSSDKDNLGNGVYIINGRKVVISKP